MANQEPEKLAGTSMDISAENRTRLKQLFPSVFTETRNAQGVLVESIDFEKLKAEIGTFSDLFESRRERYGMDWPGKKDTLKLIQSTSCATLKPCREESVHFDTTENLFIEGDNLEVLKLLQKSYYGKVKMIYIDPPYNTGKEFIYPDNFSENLETYLEYAGLIDGEGKKFSTNTANEGRFHTKWLNMMYPRLYLARNLLLDDGVIFVSIDDNEVSNLRKACDEIFGEENFMAEIEWQKRYTRSNNTDGFTTVIEHILCYGKSCFKPFLLDRTDEANSRYSNPDNDLRGQWKAMPFSSQATPAQRPNLCYEIINPITKEVLIPKRKAWRSSKEVYEKYVQENLVWWGNDGKASSPSIKKFLSEARDGMTPINFWAHEFAGNTDIANREIKELFVDNVFDTPKPTLLVKRMLELSTSDSDIILDFFAGSATTAHAVLDLNKDGGNRKFILVQLPEPCAEDSEAFKAGYMTIADIGKERIRRVIKKLNEEQEDTLDLDQARNQDRGFKVLKLDKSNFKQWQHLESSATPEEIVEQLELHIDHISAQATQEAMLYEILLKAGFAPTAKIENKIIADKHIFCVADGELLLCLEDAVTRELIEAAAEAGPKQFICLDSAFHGNDQLKANAVQTFAARNMQKAKHDQIVFRTI